jgi:hypothetical protein
MLSVENFLLAEYNFIVGWHTNDTHYVVDIGRPTAETHVDAESLYVRSRI